MAEINWSAESRRDLKSIAEFYEVSSASYSNFIVSRIIDAVDRIQEFPEIGRQVPKLDQDMFRERIVDGFRIIYLLQGNSCEILTTVHSRRDLIRHLKRS
ncbi:MAG: type II toxin-antitoxin system RelE/ParE family toxin [Balneolaceae bacterium]|nr:type II toxin-antitoxin system RelE/ParE family toxin [Balneolaceae bacterium]